MESSSCCGICNKKFTTERVAYRTLLKYFEVDLKPSYGGDCEILDFTYVVKCRKHGYICPSCVVSYKKFCGYWGHIHVEYKCPLCTF